MSTKDQASEETTEEETEEESEEEESSEEEDEEESKEDSKKQSKETDITPEKTHKLAQAIQKGYTITRQEMAKIKGNQESIQAALEKLAKDKEDEFDGEEPLTVDKFLKLQKEQAESKEKEMQKINDRITDSLNELKAEGIISSKEEEDSLLEYAVKHKITDLNRAASQWKEWYDMASQNKAKKDKAKGDVRKEAGKKVGTSKKTKVENSGGVDYNEIRQKSMVEIADEE